MPLIVNGVDIRRVVVNGVDMRELFANGALVWSAFDGQFLYDLSANTTLVERYTNQWRHETPVHFFAATNNGNPLGFISGNKENPSENAINWFTAPTGVYGIWATLQQWRSGPSDNSFMQIVIYGNTSTLVTDSTDIVFYKDGVRTVTTTVGAMKALGFTEEYEPGGGTYYPPTNSQAPNSPFKLGKVTLLYEGPDGSAGDATVEQWLTALIDTSPSGFVPIDRRIEIGSLSTASTHTMTWEASGTNFGLVTGSFGSITPTEAPSPVGDVFIDNFFYSTVTASTILNTNNIAMEGVELNITIEGVAYYMGVANSSGTFEATDSNLATVMQAKANANETDGIKIEFVGEPLGARHGFGGGITVGQDGSGNTGFNSVVASPYGSINFNDRNFDAPNVTTFQWSPGSQRFSLQFNHGASAAVLPSRIYLRFNGVRYTLFNEFSNNSRVIYRPSTDDAIEIGNHLVANVGNTLSYLVEDYFYV